MPVQLPFWPALRDGSAPLFRPAEVPTWGRIPGATGAKSGLSYGLALLLKGGEPGSNDWLLERIRVGIDPSREA